MERLLELGLIGKGFLMCSKIIFGGLTPCWVKKINSLKVNFLRQKTSGSIVWFTEHCQTII
jgi:hypothetical protein